MFARSGTSFQVFYLTPDGQAEIDGVMWDAAGKNITRGQVASIDGAIPTVTIGAAQGPTRAALKASVQKTMTATAFGTAGASSAPRLWMFADPMCSYSQKAMAQLQPYIAGGRVQLAVVPISVLDYEDQGASTASAKIMVSLPPDQMVEAWVAGKLAGVPDTKADDRLRDNLAAANAIHLRGTPTFLWQAADSSEGRSDGRAPSGSEKRMLVRKASSAAVRRLAMSGALLAAGDMDDHASLDAAKDPNPRP